MREKKMRWAEVERRPLAYVCAAFSGAVLLSVYLLTGWQMLLGGGLLFLCGIGMALAGRRRLGVVVIAISAGLLICALRNGAVTRWEDWMGRVEPLTLQAADYPQATAYGSAVEAVVESPAELKGARVQLYLPQTGLEITPGDGLECYVKLRCARQTERPWTYYRYSNGIFLTGSTNQVTVTDRSTPIVLLPRVWAHELGTSLGRLFPQEEAGFLLALTTGNRSGLSEDLSDALTRTGLRHIVAASGLHLNLILTILFLLPGNQRRRGLLLLPCLLAFSALAGFTPSICRAAVMEAVILLGPVVEREEDGLTSLFLALALILLHNPYAVAGVGLQLSFAAMLGLLTVAPELRKRRKGRIWGVFSTTLGANAFTVPLVLYYFGAVSVLTPVSNLVVLWILPVLLPLGMLCALAGICFGAGACLLAAPTGLLTGLLIRLIRFISALPVPMLTDRSPQMIGWVVLAYSVFILIFLRMIRGRESYTAIALLALTLILCLRMPDLPTGAAQLSLLDVGQGQCILLTSGAKTAVLDCGSLQGQAFSVLEQALAGSGRSQVDLVILTHYDSDHINGLPSLLRTHSVARVIAPPPGTQDEDRAQELWTLAEQAGAQVEIADGEEQVALERWNLSLIPVEANDNGGLAVLASAGEFDLLVTGDADCQAEEALLARRQIPDIEVLVAGHHGSKYSTGDRLLNQTAPEAVLISVGKNSFGHPAGETLERCESEGAEIWRTDQNGTLTVWVNPEAERKLEENAGSCRK